MSLSDLLCRFDEKIRAAGSDAEVRSLREERNAACSGTRKLPPEMLSEIFEILASNLSDSFYSSTPSKKAWVAVTRVCRTWRNVALSSPRLWSNFIKNFPSERWQQEMLGRAKFAPLTLDLDVWKGPQGALQRLSEIVLDSPERLKALTVGRSEYHLQLTKCAPNLEKLEIRGAGKLPSNFLGGYAPRLHSFVSTDVVLPMDAPWMSNIRTLGLSGNWSLTQNGSPGPTNILTLLHFLQLRPHVEELAMSIHSNLYTPTHPTPGMVVHLPLKSWEIDVFYYTLRFERILDVIALDSLQTFTLRVKRCRHQAPLPTLQKALSFFVSNTRAQRIILKSLSYDSGMQLIASSPQGFRDLSFNIPDLTSSETSDVLNLSGVEIKGLMLREMCHGALPSDLHQDPACIEELYIEEASNLHHLIPFPYPSLRLLHLKRASFTPKFEVLDRLKQWIRWHNILEHLTIEGCRLTKADIASLAEVVPVTAIDTLLY